MHITTKGSDPKMLSNKGVFTVNDPLYYCGHPQVSFKYGISILIDFLWLYKSLTNKLLLEDINYSSTDNSNGGKNEAMVIHSITLKSRVYTVIKHSSPHTKQWIGFELKSINIDTNTIVVFELTSFDNKIIFLRRKILLQYTGPGKRASCHLFLLQAWHTKFYYTQSHILILLLY